MRRLREEESQVCGDPGYQHTPVDIDEDDE
jgi:hypothetical protein